MVPRSRHGGLTTTKTDEVKAASDKRLSVRRHVTVDGKLRIPRQP